jgi:hypothetical protein
MKMKEIQITNIGVLKHLDDLALQVMKMPHTFSKHPKPNVTFARLKEIMADDSYEGYPDIYNYSDFTGESGFGLREGTKKTLIKSRHYFIKKVQAIVPGKWYFDTLAVYPSEYGHGGWQNSKNKPRQSIRFIYNAGDGYSIGVDGNSRKQLTIKDRNNNGVAKNWTCIYNEFSEDGQTWFADRNAGSEVRVVIDLSIKNKYKQEADKFIEYLQSNG